MKKMIRKVYNNLRYMDKPLLIVSMILIIYGLFNIVTASSREAISIDAPLFYYFFKHGEMLLIGLILGLIILNVDTKKYKKITILLYIIIGVCLLYLTFYGVSNRGAKNWLKVGPITFQPSEFVKVILIVFLAYMLVKLQGQDKTEINKFWKLAVTLLISGVPIVLIVLEPDYGTVMAFVVAIAFMLFAYRNR